MKSLWQSHDYQERVKIGRVCSLANEKERRRKISEALKRHFSHQSSRDSLSFAVAKALKSKRRKISNAMKKKWQDPAWRAKVVESQKKNADDLWGFKMDLRRRLNRLG